MPLSYACDTTHANLALLCGDYHHIQLTEHLRQVSHPSAESLSCRQFQQSSQPNTRYYTDTTSHAHWRLCDYELYKFTIDNDH